VRALVWIAEGTWSGCADAARAVLPGDAEVTLLHVTPTQIIEAGSGALAGLLGRASRREPAGVQQALDRAADDLLTAAVARFGRPAHLERRTGRVEREVVAAAHRADVLVLARDGDRDRLGPRSLGPATRFVVDHAPCDVLLVWPDVAPGLGSLPPPPGEGPPPGPPPP
jgi:nucleotide-binding universal stress UspA family protein